MKKVRLDQTLVMRGLVATRSQAESYIKLGQVKVEGRIVTKPGYFVSAETRVVFEPEAQYVSRAGLKLASVAEHLNLNFNRQVVLDVGSSTGGFSDYALQHGAKKVIAVDVGSNQMHASLRDDPRLELHEKTDIRDFAKPKANINLALIDVSFISLRDILPSIARLCGPDCLIVAMVKPQFEAQPRDVSKGVIKNDNVRRQILRQFELWVKKSFVIVDKADSAVAGAKGNRERFFLLKKQP